MQTSPGEIARQAREDGRRRFTNLAKLLSEEFLIECFKKLNKKAAAGIDGVKAHEFGQSLDSNVAKLLDTLKRGTYRARFVRRKYIKKPNGKMRPPGIPAIVDKLLQLAGMLDLRIGDGTLKRLIRKWLKAGVLEEDGMITKPHEGTPRGGTISPILANVYLHYALDLWFEKVIKKNCEGEAYLIRYADDFVALFRYKSDAEMYYRMLGQRLAKFGLELAEDKTHILSFSRFRKHENTKFSFLGIEFRWGTSRNGKDIIKRRTDRAKLRKSLQSAMEWCKENRNQRLRKQAEMVKSKLRGYYNHYGIAGNAKSLEQFYQRFLSIWYKWLNRRSQRRSYNWEEFRRMLKTYGIPSPRITEQWAT